MTLAVVHKLLALFLTVALGWAAARWRWLGADATVAARVLGQAAFGLFVPALLFRTTARLDLAALPWRTVAAYFVPVLLFALAVYLGQRRRQADGAAAPSVRAISASFGNSVQLGIPMAAALFGEAGLAIHVALISVHALLLLTLLTALAEIDLARQAGPRPWLATLRGTVRNTVIHPVVLPVLAGLAWRLTGWPLHPVVDETLAALAMAVVPLCLVLIGVTLACHGVLGRLRGALGLAALKLLALPALVLLVARWGFGLDGLALAVLVLMAALPTGSNALLFAQRYDTLAGEVTTAIVLSTLAFAATAALWLSLLAHLG